jgi:hypothetical protein
MAFFSFTSGKLSRNTLTSLLWAGLLFPYAPRAFAQQTGCDSGCSSPSGQFKAFAITAGSNDGSGPAMEGIVSDLQIYSASGQLLLSRAFPELGIADAQWSSDGQVFTVTLSTPDQPGNNTVLSFNASQFKN